MIRGLWHRIAGLQSGHFTQLHGPSAFRGALVRGEQHFEAAQALALSRLDVNRYVRIPLALRIIIPPLTNQYIWLMKATTVGIAIGYPDFFMIVSTSINQSGQTIELIAIMMSGYLLINYVIASLGNLTNGLFAGKRVGRK